VYWLGAQSWKFLLKLKQLISLHVVDTKLGKGDIVALLDNLKSLGEQVFSDSRRKRKLEISL
jgi:hypothetical protein